MLVGWTPFHVQSHNVEHHCQLHIGKQAFFSHSLLFIWEIHRELLKLYFSVNFSSKPWFLFWISMRLCGSIARWSVFIQPCNHRLLTTKKVVDECKAIKLVYKCSRKNFQRLELFDSEKVFCFLFLRTE